MQATRALRQSVQRATSADTTKYHQHSTGFWEKFRLAVVVNPSINTGMQLNNENRYPQPASRPEEYVTPASKAYDPAENPYYARDARRKYPKLQAVTQEDLAALLIAAPEQMKLPAPGNRPGSAQEGSTALANASNPPPSLASLYAGGKGASGAGWLPPTPPGKPHRYKESADVVPHSEHAYFPMVNYS